MKTLISMEDYVIETYNDESKYMLNDVFAKMAINYAELLKSKPTLGQFVPTDDEGNVLEEPHKDDSYEIEAGSELFQGEIDDYQTALDKVIFDGWVLYEVTKHSTIIVNGENYIHFYFDNDVYINHANISTISDLIKYNLKLK